MKREISRSIWMLLAVLFLAGCAAGGMKKVEKAGFLGDYSQLKPGGEDRAALLYVKPGLDLKPYDKIMFERVVVLLSPEADYKAVDPAFLKEMTDYFQTALYDAVKDGYQVVDQPGPGVLRVRAAITDLKPSKPVANTMSTILPIGWAVAGATKLATDDNVGTGEAEMSV